MTVGGRRLSQLARTDVGELHRVTDQRGAALAQMGVTTVFDLLTTYPRRYVDRTRQAELEDLSVGDEVAVLADVDRVSGRRTRQGRALVEAVVTDGTGVLSVVFFNQAWRQRQLAPGTQALFFGKVTDFRGRRQMTNPVVDVLVGTDGRSREASRVLKLVPIYPASGKAGLTSWEIGGCIEEALERAGEFLDPVPEAIRRRLDLVDRTTAFAKIHLPERSSDHLAARRRLAFDELFRLQLLLALRRRRVELDAVGVAHPADLADLAAVPGELARPSLVAQFLSRHRFELTTAQRRVLEEIFRDLASPAPMHRLLQGDVGSGKTVVALAAALAVVGGGRQVAVMAPTEVLAEQLFSVLRHDLAQLGVADSSTLAGERPLAVRLLTASAKAKERTAVLADLASGAADIVVGTHALLGEQVRFRALGLVVIDEQHRFGVEQRALLREKGRAHSTEGVDPDLLVMTATPIPRTAAMVLFSDLDLSTLDEMPAGRLAVATTWLPEPADASVAWSAVIEAVPGGHRAFVVCPLIEESDRAAAAGAVAERDRLANGPLKGLRLGLLHGQLPSAEKDEVMAAFRRGDLDVLVATVVIEVGVDVPEATVMVIEDAWRFGLAQLHQLRGRVGRSTAPGMCFLLGDAPTPLGRERLAALTETTDGFALAEIDLRLRGEGTLLGVRQRGRTDLDLADLFRDADLLEAARDAAAEVVATGGGLVAQPELADELALFVDEEEATFLFKS